MVHKPTKMGVKHVQVAGGIVIHKESGKILVVNQHGRAWSLPKGHIEEGEEALAAAKREIYEESGVPELEYVRLLGSYERYKMDKEGGDDLREKRTITLFLFYTTQNELKPLDPSNPEAKWVDKEQVAELLTHRKDKEFFLQIKNNL